METIKRIQQHENTKIRPGELFRFSEAVTVYDGVAQGDLYIMIADQIPEGYFLVQTPKEIDKQLVPGNTRGAKHCLDSLEGVELFWPQGWSHSETYDELQGPGLICHVEKRILHPTHGPVIIPGSFTIITGYQRVHDHQLKRQRRAMD